ncbi:MAG: GntR family transcriptional regulator [Exilispira sp.]
MRFDQTKPIYLQIIELIYDLILQKKWKEESRIPAIREFSAQLEVNPNTVAKAYNECLELGIFYNKRGIGYFLSKDSYEKILKIKREEFFKEKVPNLIKNLSNLGISIEEFISYINLSYIKGEENEK